MWQAIGHATARTAHAAKAPVTGATVRLAAISQRRGFFTARVFFAPAGTAKKSKSASKKGSDAPKASKTSAAAKTPATGTADEGRKDRSDASSDRQRNSEAILLERQKRKEEREAKTAERRQKKDKQRMAKARAKARAKATAKNAEVKRKLELEKLKEMSLLEEEPKLGAVNTWGYYVAQHAKGKMSNPEGFTGLVAALQKSYNSMSQAERKVSSSAHDRYPS